MNAFVALHQAPGTAGRKLGKSSQQSAAESISVSSQRVSYGLFRVVAQDQFAHSNYGKESIMVIAINLPSPDGPYDDPQARAREFIAAWYMRWGGLERLSDVPLESEWLLPWSEDLGLFELVDYGSDFRLREIGRKLAAFLGVDHAGMSLSKFPQSYRQALRQVVLRAAMLKAPAAERHSWLVGDCRRSCIVCAAPVAGNLNQPTQLLTGIFHRSWPQWPTAERLTRMLLSRTFSRASQPSSPSRRSASAVDS
jgi:hypothetical protein